MQCMGACQMPCCGSMMPYNMMYAPPCYPHDYHHIPHTCCKGKYQGRKLQEKSSGHKEDLDIDDEEENEDEQEEGEEEPTEENNEPEALNQVDAEACLIQQQIPVRQTSQIEMQQKDDQRESEMREQSD